MESYKSHSSVGNIAIETLRRTRTPQGWLLFHYLQLCIMFTILFSNIFCKHHLMRIGKCLLSIGQLKEKSLICLHGGESMVTFLQGLISNDVKCISQPNSFMYSLFLNSKGRVLTDAFIYHTNRLSSTYQSNYLIEVDHVYTDDLVKHLSRYNLRGRVKIDTSLQLCPWIAMPTSSIQSNQLNNSQAWLPVNNNLLNFNDQQQVIFYASDPRGISGWSGRILSRSNTNVRDIFTSCNTQPLDIEVYHNARWRLGLPEGVHEFITNDTLPFEANTDLSGGVSFSKGCYIGQELTARTHFTGVIRRRYIPIRIVSMGNNADVLMKTMNAAKSEHLRRHSKRIQKQRTKIVSTEYWFSHRVINCWNRLPEEVVSVSSIHSLREDWISTRIY
ncbi:unnamed protein product [Heterobilharzia americana]|nr:unnamed protein product [Heterobilharzia americana]